MSGWQPQKPPGCAVNLVIVGAVLIVLVIGAVSLIALALAWPVIS